MRRSSWSWGAAIAVACGALALGCGQSEEPTAATPPSPTASEPVRPSADVAAPTAPTPSAVDTCVRLADQRAWGDALEPCTEAAQQRPDDLRIRHALQQAQAAAAEQMAN